jgi:AcrR family transcriptional regulator
MRNMSPHDPPVAPDAMGPDRRSRLRAWTLEQLKEAALRQIAEHGVEGLSLNAIAKDLGMSGPALYRYVASRDELIVLLVVDAWQELGDALMKAAAEPAADAARRVKNIGRAYRAWGLSQPDRYKLAVTTRLGSGQLGPEHVIPAATRAMGVALTAMAELPETRLSPAAISSSLGRDLERWRTERQGSPDIPASVLLRGVLCWSRLHGLLTLEIDGYLASMGIDPEPLYASELDAITGSVQPWGQPTPAKRRRQSSKPT